VITDGVPLADDGEETLASQAATTPISTRTRFPSTCILADGMRFTTILLETKMATFRPSKSGGVCAPQQCVARKPVNALLDPFARNSPMPLV
jgi:hypothetical protein